LRERLAEAVDLPEGIIGSPDNRPMARKDDPGADRFHQRHEASLGLPLIPTEAIDIPPAILPAEYQISGNKLAGRFIEEDHRVLCMPRRGDHFPTAEADPRSGESISFEIPDAIPIGNELAIPKERQGHAGWAVEGQIGPFPDAKAACNQGGK